MQKQFVRTIAQKGGKSKRVTTLLDVLSLVDNNPTNLVFLSLALHWGLITEREYLRLRRHALKKLSKEVRA